MVEYKHEFRPLHNTAFSSLDDTSSVCGDACPAGAITFGDWNDVNSDVRASSEDKRSYQVLEEIGVKPNIWYKVKVRNEEDKEVESLQVVKESIHHGDSKTHDENHSHAHEENHNSH